MFKEIGTLAEIGAKVGDVVEAISYCGVVLCRFIVEQKDIDEMVLDNYRIVSRAKSGPVITETVKRIVPGVYGKVSVLKSDGWWFALTDKGDKVAHVKLSRADLIAARDVFNQLIDAMEE